MRQFYLLNSIGAQFNLMRPDAFFHSPSGLGSAQTLTYLRVGDHFEQVEGYESQKTVSGEMIFRTYQGYNDFAKFVSYKPLTLVYNPDGTEYRLDCDLSKLGKTEIDHNTNRLICSIEFKGRSKWYYNRTAIKTEATGVGTKTYQYTYPYMYTDSANGVIESVNEGFGEAPCRLHIMGAIENPTWTLSVNNQQIAGGACSVTIPDGHKLVIDSRDNHLEVAEYTTNNEFIQNLYGSCDYSQETFLYLPVGGFKILVQGVTADGVNAYLEIIEQYDTV